MKDEDFYGEAAREIATRTHSEALMAKAYALALGDAEKTKALYIGMRADQLKDEVACRIAASIALSELERKRRSEEEQEEKRALFIEEKRQRDQEKMLRRQRDAEDAKRAAEAWNAAGSRQDGWPVTSQVPKSPSVAKVVPPEPRRSPVPPVDLDYAIKVMREGLEEANRKMKK